MTRDLDLDVDHPDKVAAVLRRAADVYYDAAGELSSAWQDPEAGKPWYAIARILERAANSVDSVA
jgi:hypothetical protein